MFPGLCNARTKPASMGWQNVGSSLKNTSCAKPFDLEKCLVFSTTVYVVVTSYFEDGISKY